jgi:hypothetical protein
MADSLQLMLWHAMLYTLGAIGLFAIGALPFRAYTLIRSAKSTSHPARQVALAIAVSLTAIALAAPLLLQVAKCLLGYHCSANVAGGWINAAFIGIIYLSFEIVMFAIRRFGGRTSVAA